MTPNPSELEKEIIKQFAAYHIKVKINKKHLKKHNFAEGFKREWLEGEIHPEQRNLADRILRDIYREYMEDFK